MTIPASGTPEYDKAVEALRSLPREQLLAQKALLERQLLIDTARGPISPDGFAAHFELIFAKTLLRHQRKVIDKAFVAHGLNKGIVAELFRGAAKTTTITLGFGSYLIAKYPDKAGLLIQVGDDSAADNGAQIADIIRNNPGWKATYPHIVPDEEQGWGASGYEVKLTHTDASLQTPLPYSDWRQMNAQRKDPTVLAVGYKSRALIGRRPYWLIVDDINDENNTISDRELRKVKSILTGTIFPAANMSAWRFFIGTPWNENDALHYCLQTGQFEHVKVAVYTDGLPTWPEVFGENEIARHKALSGEIEFARMFLLDLSKTKGLTLLREWIDTFPNTEISPNWPRFIGVDFTSTEDPRKLRGDYFVLMVGAALPGNQGLVIEDGIRARVSQAEAQDLIVSWCARYPTLQIVGVEAIIQGQNFYNQLLDNAELRKANLILKPVKFSSRKGQRYEKVLAPLFQRRRVRLSDAEKPIFSQFIDEWMNWQGDALEAMYHNDTLDAAYALCDAADYAFSPVMLDSTANITNPMYQTPADSNPFVSAWSKRT